ncbi:hypothetical protein OPV22_022143 [Ensete ventricosum]|uniref:Uncharacterized protein n=1 Tax=Ensete ventricosum TaxID=4639 RepID=A0AAV8PBN2_ENSVE|nr:hypothetical protein OPV22_022143 [Ensete ventricosum]
MIASANSVKAAFRGLRCEPIAVDVVCEGEEPAGGRPGAAEDAVAADDAAAWRLEACGTCVGSVVRVDSSVRSIDEVLSEVKDDKIILPRNSLVEHGVSLDALVGVFTRLGQEMNEIGISQSYRLAEKVASVVEEVHLSLQRFSLPS